MAIDIAAAVTQVQKTSTSAATQQMAAATQGAQQTSSATASTPVSSTYDATDLKFVSQSSSNPLSSIAENALSHLHGEVAKLDTSLPSQKPGTGDTAFDAAKKDMAAQSDNVSPTTKTGETEGPNSLTMLNKTFDHAIFMAMVNQVISGVGDTSRTLIRQQ